ncbi:MAG: hypothetical protein PF483_13570, partial [Halothiobacillus sp.]|nr:hypothetical protein [Halothiobacillus sp.]
MNSATFHPIALLTRALAASSVLLLVAACGESQSKTDTTPIATTTTATTAVASTQPIPVPLRGEFISRGTFANPHAHIPAQCSIETGHGTQSACLFCHTNGVAALNLGNNNPQAGANANIGNLQADYAFGVVEYPFVVNSSINPWINTLKPEVLHAAVIALGET